MKLRQKTGRRSGMVLAGSMLAGLILLLLMQAMTTYTYDDYYYAVFLRQGLRGFWEQNVTHYLVRNGRVLVHAAAELLLAGGSWVYSLGNTVILAGSFLLGLRYLRQGRDTDRLLEAGCAMAMVLLGTMRVFRSWFLCPADAVNYTLPLAAVFAMLLALGRRRPAAVLVLSLLCGATTELCSAMGFAAATLELLWERARKGRWDRLRLAGLVCVLGGLATIVLSPATRQRVGSEFSLAGIGMGFLRYANSIAAPGSSLSVLTVVSLLLTAGLPGRLRRAGIPVALLLASGWFLPRSTRFTAVAFAVFCLWVLFCAGVMILRDQERRCGFVLLAGLGSAAMMTLTDSGSVRVTIPFVICLILVGAHLVGVLGRETGWPLRSAAAAVLLAALIFQLPTAAGITGNWQIMVRNARTLTGDPAVYEDYDPRYCTQQVFMSTDHQRVYLNYLGLADANIQYTYSWGPEIPLGDRLQPTLYWRDGVYVPLRAAVEANGGSVSLISDSFLEIRLDGRCWLYQAPTLYSPTGKRDVTWDLLSVENQFYISCRVLEQELGIQTVQGGQ